MKKRKFISFENLKNLENLRQRPKFTKFLVIKTVDLIKYCVLFMSYTAIWAFIDNLGFIENITTSLHSVILLIYICLTIKLASRYELENYNIILGDNKDRSALYDFSEMMYLVLNVLFTIPSFVVLDAIFDMTNDIIIIVIISIFAQLIISELLVLSDGEVGYLIKKAGLISMHNLFMGEAWLKVKNNKEEVLYRRVSYGVISDYRRVFILPTNEVKFLIVFGKAIFVFLFVLLIFTGNVKYSLTWDIVLAAQISILGIFIVLNTVSYKIRSRFSNTILKQSYYNKVSFMYWLALDLIMFIFIINPNENLKFVMFYLMIATALYFILIMCAKSIKVKKYILKKYVRQDVNNFQVYNNMIMRLKTEESFNESQYQLVSALNDNESQGAVLVSGPWGSGKTFLVQNTIPINKEIDLLKFGSGQNMFYAMFRALTKPFGSINLKLNILNFLKNPELIYILIGLNLAYVPVLALIKQPYLIDDQGVNQPHLALIILTVGVLNLVILQILPYIVFSRDISNNRFRKMYLDLMTSQVENEVLVIENLDRLEWVEINEVLEILNYLKDNGKKVVVTADFEYLKFKYKQHLNKEGKDYVGSYFNRYFKDAIYIPLSTQYKLKTLLEFAKRERVFIAPYEHRLILNILEQYSNTTIREIERFIEKYKSRIVINQVSYDLFLFLNNSQRETSIDIATLEQQLQAKWCDILDENRKNINECSSVLMQPVYGKKHHIYVLLNSEYCYANIPRFEYPVNLYEGWPDKLAMYSEEEINIIKSNGFTSLSLSDEELKLYRKVPYADRRNILMFLKNKETTLDKIIEIAQEHLEIEYKINIGTVDLNNVLCAMYINVIIEHGEIGESTSNSAFSYV